MKMKTDPVVFKLLSRVAVYIMLFVIFRTLFHLIIPYYLHAGAGMTGPIDAHATCFSNFFDAGYVQEAKDRGYDHAAYFELYLPLDLIFPLIYTSMFVIMIKLYEQYRIYDILKWMIIAGCVFDYLENSSFSIFLLLKGNGLAPVVAFFTTIKTCLFVSNCLVFLVGFLIGIFLLFRKPNTNNAP